MNKTKIDNQTIAHILLDLRQKTSSFPRNSLLKH
mgnify:CR=1 FL=1